MFAKCFFSCNLLLLFLIRAKELEPHTPAVKTPQPCLLYSSPASRLLQHPAQTVALTPCCCCCHSSAAALMQLLHPQHRQAQQHLCLLGLRPLLRPLAAASDCCVGAALPAAAWDWGCTHSTRAGSVSVGTHTENTYSAPAARVLGRQCSLNETKGCFC
jgi:hypothetical protein